MRNSRVNVHDEEQNDRPSIQTEALVSKVDQKHRGLSISALGEEWWIPKTLCVLVGEKKCPVNERFWAATDKIKMATVGDEKQSSVI